MGIAARKQQYFDTELLPNEVLQHIFYFADVADILSAACVSKRWNEVLEQDIIFWRSLWRKRFGTPPDTDQAKRDYIAAEKQLRKLTKIADKLVWAVEHNYHCLLRNLLRTHDKILKKEEKISLVQNLILKATEKGHLDSVMVLVAAGADINHRYWNNATLLMLAAKHKQHAIVDYLLRNNADYNITFSGGPTVGATALYLAAEGGSLECVKLLVEKGADVNRSIENGATPLYIASQNKSLDVVEYLLKKGANIEAARNDGCRALYLVSFLGQTACADLLLRYGAQVSARLPSNGLMPIHAAASKGHIDTIQVLLDYGADLESPNINGATPLYFAAQEGQAEVVKFLLSKGAEIEAPLTRGTAEGTTPLSVAAHNGRLEVVKILLEAGANITAQDITGAKPVDNARRNGHTEVEQLLQQKEAELGASLTHKPTLDPQDTATAG